MRSSKNIVVTKRDGTLERFHVAKLTNCLAQAIGAHAYDERLAGPLARAVAMHLVDWQEPSPPTTSYIYHCVRTVLQQTGLSEVADALADHRRLRRMRRRRIRVIEPGRPGRGEAWNKSAIVGTLQHRFGLRHAVSRFMAGRIEAQIFTLDYRVVTRPFLAELVRNEVLAWGLADEQVLQENPDSCTRSPDPNAVSEES
ncbi:MAG: hypothetical protein IPM18_02015 [Phycisphaerales bacterium]|nr:hypothetical protein [Phycisphaerales bacterium]